MTIERLEHTVGKRADMIEERAATIAKQAATIERLERRLESLESELDRVRCERLVSLTKLSRPHYVVHPSSAESVVNGCMS